jgi:S-adenosylmethionine:tRNA ribosyltransferase-isomerase
MRRTADYSFDLPPEAIAQVPAERRDASRLLQVGRSGLNDLGFADFLSAIPQDAVVVVNDTKVIRARLRTHKETGGAVELLLLEPLAQSDDLEPGSVRWRCLAKASKALRDGNILTIAGTDRVCRVVGERDAEGGIVVQFSGDVFALLEAHGELPLPPYIERSEGDTEADRLRYQTLFAREQGAVAAPTAGLHFSEETLAALDQGSFSLAPITLHVGLGTFAPVRVDCLDDIVLHEERYSIPERSAELIESGRPVVAIGTTVVRALESAAIAPKKLARGAGRTSIFISPGYQFQVVDHLLTNFHLPGSTLLMLVCAFGGYDRVMSAYAHAVAKGYRFYSYGDAMLLSRDEERC